MKNNQNGRSMVEMLGVLAIIGVLSAGGLAGYSKAMFKHKLNNTMDQITMLVTNIRTMYGTQDSYADIGTTIDKLGIIPAAMGSKASKLVNPFKGTVSIAPSDAASNGDNRAFTVTYAGLPTEACIALSTADWGSGAGSGFIGVSVTGAKTEASGQKVGDAGEGKALTMSQAIDACAVSDKAKTASVTVKFY